MMKLRRHSSVHLFILFCTFLLLCCSQQSSAQEPEEEREFDYFPGSPKGPKNWGNLKKEWSGCGNGKQQSPVNLSTRTAVHTSKLGMLRTMYKPCNASVKNRGHDIAVDWEGRDAGWFMTNRPLYKLRQLHWHSPSEHTINGKVYDLELHMVHTSTDPKSRHQIAVVSLLYVIGQPDPFLTKVFSNVTLRKAGDDEEDEEGEGSGNYKIVDPNTVNVDLSRYYRYVGSLTVPPCTENVLWTINSRVRTVSEAQLELLKESVHDFAENNARPVQPLNGRWIYYNTNARGLKVFDRFNKKNRAVR